MHYILCVCACVRVCVCVCVCVCVVFPSGSDSKESTCWLQLLGQEDPLEKGMGTHSSTLARKIPWTEEPGGPQSMR